MTCMNMGQFFSNIGGNLCTNGGYADVWCPSGFGAGKEIQLYGRPANGISFNGASNDGAGGINLTVVAGLGGANGIYNISSDAIVSGIPANSLPLLDLQLFFAPKHQRFADGDLCRCGLIEPPAPEMIRLDHLRARCADAPQSSSTLAVDRPRDHPGSGSRRGRLRGNVPSSARRAGGGRTAGGVRTANRGSTRGSPAAARPPVGTREAAVAGLGRLARVGLRRGGVMSTTGTGRGGVPHAAWAWSGSWASAAHGARRRQVQAR